MKIRTAVLWLVCLLPCSAWAAGPATPVQDPAFGQYPAEEFYAGPVAPVNVSSKKAKLFRDTITFQAAAGLNFAGHYRLVSWDCGMACIAWALVDAKDGSIWFPPFTVEGGACGSGKPCAYSIDFRADSELMIVRGLLNGEGSNRTRKFRWHGGELTSLEAPEMASMEAAPAPLDLTQGKSAMGGAP